MFKFIIGFLGFYPIEIVFQLGFLVELGAWFPSARQADFLAILHARSTPDNTLEDL
jgi:hypothetical protein